MEDNGCMCTTTEGKSLLPIKGARVSDTKDNIQVRCRDGITVIEDFTYDETKFIFEELRGGADRHCRDCASPRTLSLTGTLMNLSSSLCATLIYANSSLRWFSPGLLFQVY